ncbi:MAG: hypothetical protein QOF28_1737, partial [Actinomycetota bacterium]|nr:hypothetical protein [Actinomycetota bacterium]
MKHKAWAPVLVLILGLVFGALALTFPISPNTTSARVALPPSGPSLEALNRSLELADGYVQGLYRSVGPTTALDSEYFGFPLRIQIQPGNQWILLGHDANTKVSATESGFDWEHFTVSITRGDLRIALDVRIDWAATARRYRVTITNRQFSATNRSAALFLNTRHLGTVSSRNVGKHQELLVETSDRRALQSLRYTVRHSTQLAAQYYRYHGDTRRAARLDAFLHKYGFDTAADIYAPLWGETKLPPAQLFDGPVVYHDCDVALPDTTEAYAYQSKVCRVDRDLFIHLTTVDPLVPTSAAVLALNGQKNPGASYDIPPLGIALPPGADLSNELPKKHTPRSTASWLESLYRSTDGVGVPRCLPIRCESSTASGLRTAAFVSLEASLGYEYGDSVSRSYADNAALRLVHEQVGANAIVRTSNGDYYRPAVSGAFLESWGANGRISEKTSVFNEISDRLSMPPEYRGVLVSNAETTIGVYAALTSYRCLRYRTGCP